jgi:hypothetical protein
LVCTPYFLKEDFNKPPFKPKAGNPTINCIYKYTTEVLISLPQEVITNSRKLPDEIPIFKGH